MVNLRIAALTALLFFSQSPLKAQVFGGNPARVKWQQLDSDTARIIFPKGLEAQAQRVAVVVHALNASTAYSIGSGQRKINMVLQNQTTIPNAYVRMAPFRSELFMTPGADNFSFGSIRWDDNLAIHEYRHVQQLMNFGNGLTKLFSFFLGEEGQLLANGMTVPDYFFEGDAVFQETLVSSQGRGRMPYFFNDYKALWQANRKYDWMRLRNGSLKSLSPDHYQTGYMLVAYGYEKYGPDFWKKVTQDAVRFKGLFYAFNQAVKRYSGVAYPDFCRQALDHFKAKSFTPGNSFYTGLKYLTGTQKRNVINYHNPQFTNDDAVVVVKQSYRQVPSFYLLQKGKEKKIRVKDIGLDNYFSYRNGKVVYSAYNTNARWGWQNFSDIRVLDISNGTQRKLTSKSRYFSPDISEDGSTVLAAYMGEDGLSALHLIDGVTGTVKLQLPNPNRYIFTQPKFVDAAMAIAAVRHPNGTMALVKVNLANGETEPITPFSFNVIGYPSVKNGIVYFSMTDKYADKIFSVSLADLKLQQLTDNDNGVYQPAVNSKGEMVMSVVTADGNRVALKSLQQLQAFAKDEKSSFVANDLYTPAAFKQAGAGLINDLKERSLPQKKYKKGFQLFNFHSRRPVVDVPEYGYTFFSDNMLNTFNNALTYTYNENESSHKVDYTLTYGGWYPVIFGGVSSTFNRQLLLSNNTRTNFNSATARLGAYLPFRFVSGRNSQALSLGGSFNAEQLYYTGISKSIFDNRSVNYLNMFLNFSSFSQVARQHIFARWGQTLSVSWRDALNLEGTKKLVATANLYLPGLARNHNLVLNGAYQWRDTLERIFSNTFPFSRGYEALNTRRMYKIGANYHFPIAYPDFGVANVAYLLRIRGNVFFDYTSARARLGGILQNIPAKSAGGEIFFDGKIWNALPIGIGIRYSRLLDNDLLNPGVRNVWQVVLPVGIIPN